MGESFKLQMHPVRMWMQFELVVYTKLLILLGFLSNSIKTIVPKKEEANRLLFWYTGRNGLERALRKRAGGMF